MRFAIISERRYLQQRMPAALCAALLESSHTAEVICSDDIIYRSGSTTPRFETYDAVISRDRSLVGLFLLACAEHAGVPVVNSRAAIERVRNKAEMTAALTVARIPIPPTFVCRNSRQLRSLPASFFPLVLKPNFGDNGNGVQLISADEVARVKARDASIVLAQKFIPNDGFDLKLYVVGERVWAVRKANLWSENNDSHVLHVTADQTMRSLALRCGNALGLDVYGVDALPGPDGLQVLEVNEFPNFSGIAEAPRAVAELLIAKARECPVRERSLAKRRLPARVA